MKDCGGCRDFIKLKQIQAGICEKLDAKCTSDNGKKCTSFKRPKYIRERKVYEREN